MSTSFYARPINWDELWEIINALLSPAFTRESDLISERLLGTGDEIELFCSAEARDFEAEYYKVQKKFNSKTWKELSAVKDEVFPLVFDTWRNKKQHFDFSPFNIYASLSSPDEMRMVSERLANISCFIASIEDDWDGNFFAHLEQIRFISDYCVEQNKGLIVFVI